VVVVLVALLMTKMSVATVMSIGLARAQVTTSTSGTRILQTPHLGRLVVLSGDFDTGWPGKPSDPGVVVGTTVFGDPDGGEVAAMLEEFVTMPVVGY
jgi:hypothetical protein